MQNPYWVNLQRFGDRTALIDGATGEKLTYRALAEATEGVAQHLGDHEKGLVLALCDTTLHGAVAFIAALASNHAVFLVSPRTSVDELMMLVARFQPSLLVGPSAVIGELAPNTPKSLEFAGDMVVARPPSRSTKLHPDLRLLLSTSGSSGSAKAVRLSERNICVSAWQVASALGVEPSHRALLTLPLSYTFGLSVLSSHLLCGASVVLENRSILQRSVWEACTHHTPTTMAGVAFTLEMLMKIGFGDNPASSITTLTHSGDALSPELLSWLCSLSPRIRTIRMYGMTEATSRISVLPSGELDQSPGLVGYAVPLSDITISADHEVIVSGPNIMMGYANGWLDLARGDDLGGVLHTGDMGLVDDRGRLYLTGRKSRFVKIMGARLSLDLLEERLAAAVPTIVTADRDIVTVTIERGFGGSMNDHLDKACRALRLPRHVFKIVEVDSLARNPSGKLSRRGLSDQ
ncbi:AMP-binding protein [Phenylobacterium sp.]|uniref:AMP-binding protein n=1 Tax=Phenylobacterium sp. TaxID=1871053 RepID=UPI002FC9D468